MEDTKIDLTHLIAFLSRVHTHIRDGFFAARFLNKIEHLIAAYLEFALEQERGCSPTSVAQYIAAKDVKFMLESLLELVEYLTKLNLADTTSLLQAQKLLLQKEIDFSRRIKELQANIKIANEKQASTESVAISRKSSSNTSGEKPKVFSLNENKSRILEYIKKNPDVRTKDIIKEFSSLSDRTVKRNLVELTKEGLISKRSENKAMFYHSV